MSVSSYVYNQVYNSNVDGDNEFLTIGGIPASELLNNDSISGGGVGLENKVVPVGLSVILRQPKRNTEYSVEKGQGCAVVPEDLFDRLFGSIQPAAASKRGSRSKRQKIVIKGTSASKGTSKGTRRKKAT